MLNDLQLQAEKAEFDQAVYQYKARRIAATERARCLKFFRDMNGGRDPDPEWEEEAVLMAAMALLTHKMPRRGTDRGGRGRH